MINMLGSRKKTSLEDVSSTSKKHILLQKIIKTDHDLFLFSETSVFQIYFELASFEDFEGTVKGFIHLTSIIS